MKSDKLFYRIFLNQPGLIAELIPGIPKDCEFEYSAPVIKEKEVRLDGLLTSVDENTDLPLVFLEAQMQRDKKFYSRYFRGIFSYLDQYEISRNWHGLLILRNNRLELGSEIPYQILLNNQVERLYLGEHPNFEKITAATPKTLFFPLPFVSFVSFVVRLFQVLNSNEK